MTEEATPGYRYSVKDLDENKDLGEFDNLTGGQMKIDMVNYNLAFPNGSSTTKFIPGQTSFAPIVLVRALTTGCKPTFELFLNASAGNVEYKHISVRMFDLEGNDYILWHLYNVIVTDIGGFSFNKTHYTTYKVTLQPEWIEMEYM